MNPAINSKKNLTLISEELKEAQKEVKRMRALMREALQLHYSLLKREGTILATFEQIKGIFE